MESGVHPLQIIYAKFKLKVYYPLPYDFYCNVTKRAEETLTA